MRFKRICQEEAALIGSEADDQTLDQDMLEIETSGNELTNEVAEQSQAEKVGEVLTQMEENPEQAVEIAKEHLRSVIGLSKNISHESAMVVLDKSLNVAQEGMMARFGHTLKRIFTSNEKMLKQIPEVLEAIKTNGSKTDDIKEPGWGRVFTTGSNSTISASEALSVAKDYKSFCGGSTVKLINKCADLLDKASRQTSKSILIANDEAVREIDNLTKMSEELKADIDKVTSKMVTNKRDISFKPLSAKDAEKLLDISKEIITDSAFKKANAELRASMVLFNNTAFDNSQIRLLGAYAKDFRALQRLCYEINKSISIIFELETNLAKLTYGSMQYVKASTAK
jgi:hypothetical protein